MIRFLYADRLAETPYLAATMFRDRAIQFHDRLGWNVKVDANGHERDEYDGINPLYVIWQREDGSHGGSMRFLPTVGRTMINEHFRDLTDSVRIASPLIWECTRFCLAPDVANRAQKIAAGLMLAGCEMGLRFGLEHAVGVFDARMVRIYRSIGWVPEVIGTGVDGRDNISAGLWEFSLAAKLGVATKAQISPREVENWFEESFPQRIRAAA
jgi:acyl homoserine lactone synthase